jgi:uncharacterized membrane protein YvlD (DUF360 family)
MIRLLVRLLVIVAANAVGLLVAAALLDGMQLDAAGFILALIIFTVVFALMTPFLASQLRNRRSAALGGVSLIATFVALLFTDLLSDGLSIEGIGTWIAATVIVWVASLLAGFILPFLGLKKFMEERRA